MKPPKNLLLCVLLMPTLFITISQAQRPPPPTIDQSFISFLISTKGLEFVKDLLITEAVSSLTPLDIPPIQNTRKIPFLGNVIFLLSNITIYQINVSESYIKPGDSGVAIIVSGATANLSMNWYYSYSTAWLLPIEISDKGNASVEVEGMQVGLTIGFRNQEGILKLSLLECGCFVEDINIKLDGGASWLYQGFVDAFVGEIDSAVENAVTKKLKEGLSKLDSLLQSLPNEIPIDDMAYLNVSFVSDPVLSSSSIGFEVNGLFTPRERMATSDYNHKDLLTFSCDDPSKMLGISVDEAVFRSASSLYFNAGYLQWIVDKIPDQSLLNTAGWRFIIPQLYKKYPNDDMNLNISFASAPAVRILRDSIDAMVYADLIIDVLEDHEVIPVACILLEIQATGSVKILSNYLVGSVKLDDFTMSLKWSKIGNLRMRLIQFHGFIAMFCGSLCFYFNAARKPVVWTLIQTVFLPFANTRLGKGFPLPIIRGFTLENAGISFSNSSIVVCSDVAYEKSYDLGLQIL